MTNKFVKKMNLVDVATFKEIDLFKKKAVMFIVREENYQPFIRLDWELIKSFPELNLDFYLVTG